MQQESVGTGEIVGSNLEVNSEVASALPRGSSVEAMSARTQVSGLPNDFFEASLLCIPEYLYMFLQHWETCPAAHTGQPLHHLDLHTESCAAAVSLFSIKFYQPQCLLRYQQSVRSLITADSATGSCQQ